MPVRNYANAPATTLTASCSSVATTIAVASTAGLPISYPYTLILDRGTATEEAVSVTAAAGLNLTVTRGIDSTTAFAHANGATVAHGITAQDIREANTHVNANSGVHGVTGAVVGTTDAQHLTNKTADTPATSDNDTSLATTAFVKAVLLAAHPIGDIKMSTVNVNPSTYIGGTWVAWGSGRVPVGVDAGQAEFDTVEETGGAKTHTLTTSEMPAHTHTGTTGNENATHTHLGADGDGIVQAGFAGTDANIALGGGSYRYAATGPEQQVHQHSFTTASTGGGAAHNNLQPYITCYMFKRTA